MLKLERLRLLNEKTALDNRAKMGELVNVDELGQVWTRAFAGFRSALEVIPRKLAAAHDVDSGVERELARLIDDALRELAGLELGDGEGAGAAGDADVARGPETAAEGLAE